MVLAWGTLYKEDTAEILEKTNQCCKCQTKARRIGRQENGKPRYGPRSLEVRATTDELLKEGVELSHERIKKNGKKEKSSAEPEEGEEEEAEGGEKQNSRKAEEVC